MNIYPQIKTRLAAHSAVSSKIGARAYPQYLPQKPTYPALQYSQVSEADAVEGSAELFWVRYQFDCYATTYVGAAVLADSLNDCFKEWANPGGTPAIIQCRPAGLIDDFDPDTTENGIHRIIRDFQFLIFDR